MEYTENEKKPIKIVIMGMENAGKTTILNMLTQETNEIPNKPPIMNPTKGVERNPLTLFQKEVVVWDFGGQETYRNEYLTNPEKYFHTIKFFYYVVDIQDYYRLVPSVMYFTGVFNKIKKYSPEARIIFIFHKMDPGYDPHIKNLKVQFVDKVEPLLTEQFASYLMFDTTIFNLESIKTAFYQIR
ncbi:MAG: ADP-ribosylation factor-like protein [Candidatus Odinarchaeota archaeon]